MEQHREKNEMMASKTSLPDTMTWFIFEEFKSSTHNPSTTLSRQLANFFSICMETEWLHLLRFSQEFIAKTAVYGKKLRIIIVESARAFDKVAHNATTALSPIVYMSSVMKRGCDISVWYNCQLTQSRASKKSYPSYYKIPTVVQHLSQPCTRSTNTCSKPLTERIGQGRRVCVEVKIHDLPLIPVSGDQAFYDPSNLQYVALHELENTRYKHQFEVTVSCIKWSKVEFMLPGLYLPSCFHSQ